MEDYIPICKECKEKEKNGEVLRIKGKCGTSGAGDMCCYCGTSLMTSGYAGSSGFSQK
jgi:hypothetical protein